MKSLLKYSFYYIRDHLHVQFPIFISKFAHSIGRWWSFSISLEHPLMTSHPNDAHLAETIDHHIKSIALFVPSPRAPSAEINFLQCR